MFILPRVLCIYTYIIRVLYNSRIILLGYNRSSQTNIKVNTMSIYVVFVYRL